MQLHGFENDVKMYGTQAFETGIIDEGTFENDVKMYGTQAKHIHHHANGQFENDVKMYGTQALLFGSFIHCGV